MQGQIIVQGISLEAFWLMHEEKTTQIVERVIKNYNEESDKDKLLSTKDVCDLLKITPQTLTNYCEQQKLNPLKLNGKNYFKNSDIQAALEKIKRYDRN